MSENRWKPRPLLGFTLLLVSVAGLLWAVPQLTGHSVPKLIATAIHTEKRDLNVDRRLLNGQPLVIRDPARPRARKHTPTLPGHSDHAGLLSGVLAVLGVVLSVLLLSAIAVVTLLVPMVALRLWRRRGRRRRRVVLDLALSREDVTMPYEVEKRFERLHDAFVARWYARPWLGQDHYTLEFCKRLLADGQPEARMLATCQPHMVRPIRAMVEHVYPDMTVRELLDDRARAVRPTAALHRVWRLKLSRSHVHAIQTTRDYQDSFTEGLLTDMREAAGPILVQYCLTPAPRLMERFTRWRLKSHERGLRDERGDGDREPGPDSAIEQADVQAALDAQAKGLHFVDLRIAGISEQSVRHVAGSFGAAHSHNHFVPRNARLRRALYLKRIEHGLPNPIPSWLHGVISAAELAFLWQAPRMRAKHTAVRRGTLRRAPASPAICRALELAIADDERGPIGIHEQDRRYGIAMAGGQGMGKSSGLIRLFANDTRQRDGWAPGRLRKAAALLDFKGGNGELAETALGVVPADRRVWYLNPADPEFGINPLSLPAPPSVRADLMISMIREAFGPEAVGARSDDFLRQAGQAVCRSHDWLHACGSDALVRLGLPEHPSPQELVWMLDETGDAYRLFVNWALTHDPESGYSREYWGPEGRFDRLRKANRSFVAEATQAPINKLSRWLSNPTLARLIGHPVTLSFERLIRDGDVLIVNANRALIGPDNLKLLAQMLIQLIHAGLNAQRELPPAERRQFAVSIDEAHQAMAETLAFAAAEDRSAGLELAVAYQYSEQIRDELVRAGVHSLCHSQLVFRMRELEDARQYAGLLMELYTDMINVADDTQERLRFSVDDILRVPARNFLGTLSAGETIQPAFVGGTRAMQELVDDDLAAHHRRAQRGRGCHPMGTPPYLVMPTADDVAKLGHAPVPPAGTPRARQARPRVRIVDPPTPTPVASRTAPSLFDDEDL